MESKPSGPVVLTAEEESVLKEGIYLELSQWTAMKAAVDNGWGGRDSHEKANRTLSTVVDYFIHLKDPTTGFDGLADILENGLYELNTVADDGSLEEVTETLLVWYYECLEGNYQRLEKLRATSSQRRASVVKRFGASPRVKIETLMLLLCCTGTDTGTDTGTEAGTGNGKTKKLWVRVRQIYIY